MPTEAYIRRALLSHPIPITSHSLFDLLLQSWIREAVSISLQPRACHMEGVDPRCYASTFASSPRPSLIEPFNACATLQCTSFARRCRVSWLKDFAREGNCVEESRKERSDYYNSYCTFASSPRPPPRRPIQHGRGILMCTKCRSFVAEGLWSRRVSSVEGGWKKVIDVMYVRMRLAATCSDARGVLTSCWGTGTRTPRGRKRQKPNGKKKVPRF